MIGGGVSLAMQAAQAAAYTFEGEQDAAGGWATWAMNKACGNKYTPEEGQKIFGAFVTASSSIGAARLFQGASRAWPPPYPQGSKSIDDMLDFIGGLDGLDGTGKKKSSSDRNKHGESKAGSQSKSPEPSPTAKSESNKPSQCSKGNGKRAPGDKKGKLVL